MEMSECNESVAESIPIEVSNRLALEFPNAPFNICLSDIKKLEDLYKLDQPFSSEDCIYLYDGRINKKDYYYSENLNCPKCSEEKLNKFNNCTFIIGNNNYITLRQIINEMIEDYHYNDEEIESDVHHSLVGFNKDIYKNNTYYAEFEK